MGLSKKLAVVTALTAALVAPASVAGSAQGASARAVPVAGADRTSLTETRRVDAVPAPRVWWYPCYAIAECATVKLPMDYDQPAGPKVEVALLRVKAKDQRRRIGSLFVNPGGPGGSSTQFAYNFGFYAPGLADRFDIVGMDPRGVAFSQNVKCFQGNAHQSAALAGFTVPFPVTPAETRAYVGSSRKLGLNCATTGLPLSASMSTAQVARDMDVVRRALGDARLSYFGLSYGSYLGQVYANMFPDRVRALVIDGVLDPVAWAGTPATAGRPMTARIKSGEGASRALTEILRRCEQAGAARCSLADGDPAADVALVARRLKKNPLVFGPGPADRYTYAYFVADLLGLMYSPYGSEYIVRMVEELLVATAPTASASTRAAAWSRLTTTLARAKAQLAGTGAGYGFPYENGLEVVGSVLCTDGLNPAHAADWAQYAAAADRRARYFGSIWTWRSAMCATSTWTARDDDAYRGPFTRRTSAPVLILGATWDPATNVAGAIRAAQLLPNSRLLLNGNWGHTSYGTSACATGHVDRYLLTQALPPRGTWCRGDVQPFEPTQATAKATGSRPLPVVPLVPARLG